MNRLDKVTAETRTEGSTSRTSKVTYDAVGNQIERCRWEAGATIGDCPTGTNPPSHVSTATYDARNQRLSLTDGATSQTTIYAPTHNYQPSAVYTPIAAGSELQTLFGYDAKHRLISLVSQRCTISSGHTCSATVALGGSAYAYDANDNRTTVAESHDGTVSLAINAVTALHYCYDARDQLSTRNTGAGCDAGSDEAYTYDAAGNRLTSTNAGGTSTFSYSAESQYTGASYDAAGRFSAWDGWQFTGYDANGRLTQVCAEPCGSADLRLNFTYDADGRRTGIVETAGAATTATELRYVDGRVAAEYVDGVLTRSYVTDEAGTVVKMIVPSGQASTGTYLVTWNGHGDALNLLHLSGGSVTLANSFSYETSGKSTVHTHNGFPDLGFRFRYVGQLGVQDDSVHGFPLQLMGARHYAPDLGQFIQPDPARIPGETYRYAAANPISFSDPCGLFTTPLACGTCGCIGISASSVRIGTGGILVQVTHTSGSWTRLITYASALVKARNRSTGQSVWGSGWASFVPSIQVITKVTVPARASGLWTVTLESAVWLRIGFGIRTLSACVLVAKPTTHVWRS